MSHIARIYVEDALEAGVAILLPEAQGKYLTRVMRLAEGAKIRVFNGQDGEWSAEISLSGKKVSVRPTAQSRQQESALGLTLLFAPIKKSRTDFIVEKATELGVRKIMPVITDYTQSNRVRTDRMRLLAIEAAEQTERMDIPRIAEAAPLAKALANWDADIPLIYCDEAGETAPLQNAVSRFPDRKAGLLVGPEGGFSPKEQKMLRALDFVIPITLGPRILRAETAVVSALTLWQSLVGDWQKAPYLPET